ncbi:MAG: ribonuclease III, partial [Kiritimatiellae bacterium]|nr:ribonuclease III [Kiritimatiellia bacterium]
MDEAKRRLSGALGHEWRDEALLDAALLHRSAAVERGMGDWAESQRLEFLGDAVLDLLAADWLMRRLPGVREGRLTALRSQLTCTGAFAEAARRLGLGEMVVLGVGEEKCGGRERESLLADTLEAVFGALWTDGGWAAAERAFGRVFGA